MFCIDYVSNVFLYFIILSIDVLVTKQGLTACFYFLFVVVTERKILSKYQYRKTKNKFQKYFFCLYCPALV